MKISVIVASILFLLYAIATPQKYGFYILLRVFIFVGMLYLAKISYEENKEFLLYRFLIIAFIYNPIIKLPFGKDWWIIINFFTIIFLLYALIKLIIDQNKEAKEKKIKLKTVKNNTIHSPLINNQNNNIEVEINNNITLIKNYTIHCKSLNNLNDKIAEKNVTSWTFSDGLALIKKNGLYGYINKKGEITIACIYKEAGPFSNNLARVMIDDKYGFINTRGELVIEPKYESTHSFSEGLAPVMINGKYGYINKTNDLVIQPNFYNASCFHEGRALVSNIDPLLSKLSGEGVEKWSYIDKKGRYKIKQKLFQKFDIDEKFFYEDFLMNRYVDEDFFDETFLINRFSEGLAIFVKHVSGITEKKYGYMNKNGEVVIKAIFDYAGKFSEGLAYIEYGELQGYINKEGILLISNIINNQSNLDPIIQIDSNCKKFRIDKSYTKYYSYIKEYDKENNESKDTITYLDIANSIEKICRNYEFSEGLAIAAILQYNDYERNGTLQFGYINKEGCFVIAPIFDDAAKFEDGVALVKLDGKILYIRNPLEKYKEVSKYSDIDDCIAEYDMECEQGAYIYYDSSKYDGEWENEEMHGQGTYIYPDGSKYEGEWKKGEVHGQGTLTYANGDIYIGQWKDGKKHGQGTFTYANGDIYVGEWKNNLKHGRGSYIYSNGTKHFGQWENDKFIDL